MGINNELEKQARDKISKRNCKSFSWLEGWKGGIGCLDWEESKRLNE